MHTITAVADQSAEAPRERFGSSFLGQPARLPTFAYRQDRAAANPYGSALKEHRVARLAANLWEAP